MLIKSPYKVFRNEDPEKVVPDAIVHVPLVMRSPPAVFVFPFEKVRL